MFKYVVYAFRFILINAYMHEQVTIGYLGEEVPEYVYTLSWRKTVAHCLAATCITKALVLPY